MTLLITANKKKHRCNVAFINVISKVVISNKVFLSIVVMTHFGKTFNILVLVFF